jgi:hypothetical protein
MARNRAQLDLIGMPGVNPLEIVRRFLEDMDTPNIDAILPPPDPNAPPPPEAMKLQAELEEKSAKIQLERQRVIIESHKLESEIKKLESEAIRNIAEAESKEAGAQMAQYKASLDTLMGAKKLEIEKEKVTAAAQKAQQGSTTPPGV